MLAENLYALLCWPVGLGLSWVATCLDTLGPADHHYAFTCHGLTPDKMPDTIITVGFTIKEAEANLSELLALNVDTFAPVEVWLSEYRDGEEIRCERWGRYHDG